MNITKISDGVTTRYTVPAPFDPASLSVSINGVPSLFDYEDFDTIVFSFVPAAGAVILISYTELTSGGGTSGGTAGLIVGQVIDYMGTTTPDNFSDVDGKALVNTNTANWALRNAPGSGAASIVRGTFCNVGNKLFCIMWNGSTATDGSNMKAAVTMDENDLETFTQRQRIPLFVAGVNAITAKAINADQVLVVFSSTSNSTTYSYIYTVSTDSWTQVSDFQSGVTFPVLSSSPLNSGKILCVGYSNVAKVFDPVSWTWTATGAMTKTAGFLHKLSNGKVLLTGAKYDLSSSTASVYTESTNSWSATFATPVGFKVTAAFNLADGRTAVSGGNVTNSYYLLDPTTLQWTANTFNFNKGTTANNHTSIATLNNGRVLVCWGLYNGAQGSFGTTDLNWTGWHMLEFLSTSITRFSSETRKIVKVA